MKKYINEPNFRSESINEIVSSPPSWGVRWGILFIILMTIFMFFISWHIKYPEIINGTAILTTDSGSIKIRSKIRGEIAKIYKKNESKVNKNECIAEIKNSSNKESIEFLEGILKKIQVGLKNNFKNNIKLENNLTFDSAQVEYNKLREDLKKYITLVNNKYYQDRFKKLETQIENYCKLDKLISKISLNANTKLKIATDKYNIHSYLYKEGIISKTDFYKEKECFLNAQRESLEQKRTYVQNQITKTTYKKELYELKFKYEDEIRKMKEELHSSINNLHNDIEEWKQNYLLFSPIFGKIYYLNNFKENQSVTPDKKLFLIIPRTHKYIIQIRVLSYNYGKIEIGQKVKIELDAYSANEYGFLIGNISNISSVLNKNQYLITAELSNGLITDRNKMFKFKSEMKGTAKIITKDIRLIQRIVNKFLL